MCVLILSQIFFETFLILRRNERDMIINFDSRWCHWGYFPWYPQQNHVPWGRLSLWKWVPEISPGVKAAGAFGWRTITFVVPKRQENPGALNYPEPLGPPRPVAGHLYSFTLWS